MGSFRDWLVEGKGTDSGKYKKGEFGYWWTVEQGNDDIEGTVYKGDIDASYVGLTSLRGCPTEVHGDFVVSGNTELRTLFGAPKKVVGAFDAIRCDLTDLIGCPRDVSIVLVGNNKLVTLKGAPKHCDRFDCANNHLKTLQYAPSTVANNFVCSENDITSLDSVPKLLDERDGVLACSYNKLSTLEGIKNETLKILRCDYNILKDLYGAPKQILLDFVCQHNTLYTLAGDCEFVGRHLYVNKNPKLKSLDGAPEVKGKIISDIEQ